ncbi:hypothetical protein DPEC_G00266380 [Dallia pectoralis]|uniref:Uncharacterized protein n=1 Tax=Dallia pectoralis TaxID=75939 RepID=A0ACC2FN91_DALPE|nr:hypothetical protein DPEC_G00266380 [Dallia pectoralis]
MAGVVVLLLNYEPRREAGTNKCTSSLLFFDLPHEKWVAVDSKRNERCTRALERSRLCQGGTDTRYSHSGRSIWDCVGTFGFRCHPGSGASMLASASWHTAHTHTRPLCFSVSPTSFSLCPPGDLAFPVTLSFNCLP